MSTRQEYSLSFNIDKREVVVKAMDSVGPDDCFEMLWKSVLHRYVTGEDLTPAVPRDIKDWIIKTGQFI